ALVQRAGGLTVDLHARHLARRSSDDDADVGLARAGLLQATAELVAVLRVHREHLAHAERLGLVVLVAEIERQRIVVLSGAATAAHAARASRPLACGWCLRHRDGHLQLGALELRDRGDRFLTVVAAYGVDDEVHGNDRTDHARADHAVEHRTAL